MRKLQAKSIWIIMLSHILLGGLILSACAPQQKSTELSELSVLTSSAIVVKRSDGVSIPSSDEVSVATLQVDDIAESDNDQVEVANNVIDSIIWQIQTGLAAPPSLDPVIPEGQDPSLTEDALEAAFSLLSSQVSPPPHEPDFILSAKKEMELRVGLLVPLSGQYASLGDEIRRGAEMALFNTGQDNVKLLFLDTRGGEKAAEAALMGAKNDVDIFIGPLFTPAVVAARSLAAEYKIPLLLLSNNRAVAGPDSWLMGYLPEQQLDGMLGHAVGLGKSQFAIIAQDAAFGQRLLTHSKKRLHDFGLKPRAVRVLSNAELANENKLKQAIREFTEYQPPAPDELPAESPFDTVIFAGDPEFALRTAPLLAYYDVGPDRALFVGNALWNQTQLLNEPSLQGGVFATRPSQHDEKFKASWLEISRHTPGELGRLGFDAMALVAALVTNDNSTPSSLSEWAKKLVNHRGFHGYSGAFRLLPDGSNVRAYELRQIRNGQSQIIKAAPDKI